MCNAKEILIHLIKCPSCKHTYTYIVAKLCPIIMLQDMRQSNYAENMSHKTCSCLLSSLLPLFPQNVEFGKMVNVVSHILVFTSYGLTGKIH